MLVVRFFLPVEVIVRILGAVRIFGCFMIGLYLFFIGFSLVRIVFLSVGLVCRLVFLAAIFIVSDFFTIFCLFFNEVM